VLGKIIDANGDNIYEVAIEASDGEGGTATQTISVTVTGVNDNNPVFTSADTVNVAENTTVPWIVAGPKVVRRGEMAARVKQTDTAATALWVLGLTLPSSCAGEVVREPFTAPAP